MKSSNKSICCQDSYLQTQSGSSDVVNIPVYIW